MSFLDKILNKIKPKPRPIPPPPIIPLTPVPAGSTYKVFGPDEHNVLRAQNGVGPLKLNVKCSQAALSHASRMAMLNKMEHFSLGDGGPSDRLNSFGYRWSNCGENIGEGQVDVNMIINNWSRSSGHLANILNPAYTDLGFVFVSSPVTRLNYWCALFASPALAGEAFFTEPHDNVKVTHQERTENTSSVAYSKE